MFLTTLKGIEKQVIGNKIDSLMSECGVMASRQGMTLDLVAAYHQHSRADPS